MIVIMFAPAPLFWAKTAAAQEQILVAAASDLQFVMPEMARQFEKSTGVKVELSFGSSGNFTNQIKNGAPYDVFISADVNYPQQLEKDRLVEPGTLYRYAEGKLVLWTNRPSKIEVKRGLSVLLDAGVHKIAIANPEHAPYGRAAVTALQKEGQYEKIKGKLVLGENVSQAAQFVQSRSVEVGIIPLSLAVAMQNQGAYAEVPQTDYSPIEQACVMLKSSRHKAAARQFLEFLKGPEAAALLSRSGFSVPEK